MDDQLGPVVVSMVKEASERKEPGKPGIITNTLYRLIIRIGDVSTNTCFLIIIQIQML